MSTLVIRRRCPDVPAWIPFAIARTYLILGSVVTFTLACAVSSLSSTKIRVDIIRNALNTRDASNLMIDPYLMLTTLGLLTVPVSALGVLGGVKRSQNHLFAYFFCMLCGVTAFVYVAIVCYVSAESANTLAITISAYLDVLKESVHKTWHLPIGPAASASYAELLEDVSHAQQNLQEAGALCVSLAVFMFLELWAASRVASHEWMLQRVGVTLCTLGDVVSIALLSLARFTTGPGKRFADGVGAMMLIFSFIGFAAFKWKTPVLVGTHVTLTFLLVILCAALAGVCISSGDVQTPLTNTLTYFDKCELNPTDSSVTGCVQALAAQQYASTHLVFLGGLAAVTAVVLMLNLVSALYLAYTVHTTRMQKKRDEQLLQLPTTESRYNVSSKTQT